MNFESVLEELCGVMSVSGFERAAAEQIARSIGNAFDEATCDAVGNLILTRRAPETVSSERPLHLMLDAHIDEIGFVVSGIRDDGLITVACSGGIDTLILPTACVTVHGRRELCGIICDVPDDTAAPPKIKDLYIDTGCTVDEVRDTVAVGDPVTFRTDICRIGSSRLIGHSFDDKACAAALICAVADAPREELAFDISLVLSTREEIGGGGAAVAAHLLRADAAIVTDANFASGTGVPEDESAPLGGGPMISLSAVTDRHLTAIIRRVASSEGIPISPVVEACSTGTNASSLATYRGGIPCAVLSLPLAGMHTASECIDADDAHSMIRLVGAIVTSHSAASSLRRYIGVNGAD